MKVDRFSVTGSPYAGTAELRSNIVPGLKPFAVENTFTLGMAVVSVNAFSLPHKRNVL